MNIHNFAQKTNYSLMLPSDFKITELFLQSITFPAYEIMPANVETPFKQIYVYGNRPEIARIMLTVYQDENYDAFFEIMEKMYKNANLESGLVKDESFNCKLVLRDSFGDIKREISIWNAKWTSLNDLQLDVQSVETEFTFSAEISFDYLTFKSFKP